MTAKQVDFILAGYRHPTTDAVLAGGKIKTFLDGTSTLSALWTDKDKVGTATNPVILDSDGKAEVFGDNIYKFEIYDSGDVLIETLSGLTYRPKVTITQSLSSDYGCDLSEAVAAIGSTVTTLIVDCASVIASGTTVTVPVTLSLDIINGGSFDGVFGGSVETLNINGPTAGVGECFKENLVVNYASESGYKLSWRAGDLETAIADIGTNGAELTIDTDPDDLTGALEILQTTDVIWMQGHTLGGAFTLTLNKNIQAGFYQLFESDLTVTGLAISYPEWRGADYTTDSAAAFNLAIADLSNGVLDIAGRNFRIDSTVLLKSNIKILGDLSSYIDFSNAVDLDTAFEGTGTFSNNVSLSVSAVEGDLTITAPANSMAANDIVQLRSDTVWTGTVKNAEFGVVDSVAGDVITLNNTLIDGYATASAEVYKLNAIENVVFDSVWIKGDTTLNHFGIHFTGGKNVKVLNSRFDDLKRRAVRFYYCYGFNMDNNEANRCNQNGWGYGVAVASSQTGIISNNRFYDCRHGVSLGGEAYGPSRMLTIDSNIVEGSTDAGLDAHPPSEYITWSNNIVRNSGTGSEQDGIMHQGSTATFTGNQLIDCGRHGIIIQNLTPSSLNVTYTLTGNIDKGVVGSGISIINTSGVSFKDISIVGHKSINPGSKSISITADNAIDNVTITGLSSRGAGDSGILLNASGAAIKGGSITGCTIDMITTVNEAIFLQGTASFVVENLAIIGNSLRFGSYGLRGTFTNFLSVIGNVATSNTIHYSYAGASCIPIEANVLTLNVDR